MTFDHTIIPENIAHVKVGDVERYPAEIVYRGTTIWSVPEPANKIIWNSNSDVERRDLTDYGYYRIVCIGEKGGDAGGSAGISAGAAGLGGYGDSIIETIYISEPGMYAKCWTPSTGGAGGTGASAYHVYSGYAVSGNGGAGGRSSAITIYQGEEIIHQWGCSGGGGGGSGGAFSSGLSDADWVVVTAASGAGGGGGGSCNPSATVYSNGTAGGNGTPWGSSTEDGTITLLGGGGGGTGTNAGGDGGGVVGNALYGVGYAGANGQKSTGSNPVRFYIEYLGYRLP